MAAVDLLIAFATAVSAKVLAADQRMMEMRSRTFCAFLADCCFVIVGGHFGPAHRSIDFSGPLCVLREPHDHLPLLSVRGRPIDEDCCSDCVGLLDEMPTAFGFLVSLSILMTTFRCCLSAVGRPEKTAIVTVGCFMRRERRKRTRVPVFGGFLVLPIFLVFLGFTRFFWVFRRVSNECDGNDCGLHRQTSDCSVERVCIKRMLGSSLKSRRAP